MKKYDSLLKAAIIELEEWKTKPENRKCMGTYGKVKEIITKASKCRTNKSLSSLFNYRVTELDDYSEYSKSLETVSNLSYKEELDKIHQRRRKWIKFKKKLKSLLTKA